MSVEMVTVQGRGQIVIPKDVREALSISDGDALAVYATDKVIVMKPFRRPTEEEFSGWLEEAQEWAKDAGIQKKDIDDAIRSVRRRKGY